MMCKSFERWSAVLLAAALLMLPGCKQMTGLNSLFTPKAGEKQPAHVTETAKVEISGPTENVLGCDMESLKISQRRKDAPAWDRIWAVCPASPVAGYNYAIELMKKGDTPQAITVASQAASLHPDFEPLQQLSQRLSNPYGYVGTLADRKLQEWLATKSDRRFTRTPPDKRTPPPLPKLVKSEFETSDEFRARVEKAKQQRLAQLQEIEREYESKIREFNNAVEAHNKAIAKERKDRVAAIPAMRTRFLQQAMGDVFGAPELTDPVYDADSGTFHARLVSSNGLINERVTVAVPRAGDQAKTFKDRIRSARVSVPYDFKDGKLVRGAPRVTLGKHTYTAKFTDEIFTPVAMTAMADVTMQPSAAISTMQAEKLDMSSALKEDAAYFGSALKAEEDPQLAALEQERAEKERTLKEARLQAARDAQRKRIEAQIAQLDQAAQKLAAEGGAGNEYKGLNEKTHWKFAPARTPARETVAVVIGNRGYRKGIPLVPYAYNDAKSVRQFLTTGLGVPEENILYRQDATKGEMEGLFRRTLRNRVKAGETDVIVYFSGHGMPVDTKALLLPTDARPETADITGYPRDTMLAQIDELHARSVTVILDACFSGTAQDGETLSPGKPVYKKPTAPRVAENTVLITASRANQISRMDDKAGMSLMTFYLLEGLSGKADANHDGTVSVAELRPWLEENVSRKALLDFDSDQRPEVLGPQARTLVAY